MEKEKIFHRVAVISDTHGKLRPEVAAQLATVELILHAGDVTDRATLKRLQAIAPVMAVRGNGDKALPELPEERRFELFGIPCYMIHNIRQRSAQADAAKLVVYGHSHKYENKEINGARWLNPGSCGPRRFGKPITMAMLLVCEDGTFTVEKIDLAETAESPVSNIAAVDLWKMTETVIRELKRGKTPESIARAHGYAGETVAMICQIYYTHPGVDIQGVVDRMEIAGR